MHNDTVQGENETKHGREVPLGAVRLCTVPATVYENLEQDIIYITADKAHRCLDEWRQRIEAQGSWVGPLSLVGSLLVTLLTADFKDKLGVPKEYWAATFLVCFLAAMFLLVRNIKRRMVNTPESSDEIVEKLKRKRAPAT